MSNEYGDGSTLELPFTKEQFVNAAKKCGLAVAGSFSAAWAFVGAVWQTFGARITAAIGGAAFTELTLWEAIGVALSTVSVGEIVAAGIASIGTIADLYALYVCVGSL